MGRVFTDKQINMGVIPNVNDFDVVLERFKQAFTQASSIRSAAYAGSVLTHQHTIRSDIDMLIVYEDEQRAVALDIIRGLEQYADTLNIPIDAALVSSRAVHTIHGITPGYWDHFNQSINNGGVMKGNPLDDISRPNYSHLEDLSRYLEIKLRYFEKRDAQCGLLSKRESHDLMQKILEFPRHLAVKVLHLEYGRNIPTEVLSNVDEHFASVGTINRLINEPYSVLRGADSQYTAELYKTLENMDMCSYQVTLIDILTHTNTVIELIHNIYEYVCKRHIL